MFPQRQILRSAPRFLRSPAVQRRFMSSPAPKAGENAFIKEREAVKHHAAGTTGEFFPRAGGGGRVNANWLGKGADGTDTTLV
jgi:hypothetical protein